MAIAFSTLGWVEIAPKYPDCDCANGSHIGWRAIVVLSITLVAIVEQLSALSQLI